MEYKVMPGAEPFHFPGSDVGCLLIHGFTGTTSSMREMGEYLAAQGFTVSGIRLKGHGTSIEEFNRCRYQDWVESAEAGLRELAQRCSTVFVTGLSMGGSLTLYLAARYPDKVKGIIPICGPVYLKNPLLPLVPVLKYVIKTLPGVGGDIKNPEVTELAYDKISLPATWELVKLLKVVKELLPSIRQPALIIQSREDHVVHPSNAPYIYEHISSQDKEILWLENSYHVATMDYDKELIFQKAAAFIKRITGGDGN
ncbi:MAG TPA: alpha/beta fold hydrolase [Bacillota bacterium]|jgi:carboxylesterase|nr:alpha/beta fold hydrolase [Bacillota bacterium]HOB86735.1 alpha/beta fold hydrolase [Bacillota bacterium]HOP69107.1 alpha/beta fold hydrolase [Bacillota bacterium]HPT33622.1 alpha/beta fold hydrolase [Bacillota bacterium]HQD07022.1 alpha/beta fold hydrolase [Bacillota bacterium]